MFDISVDKRKERPQGSYTRSIHGLEGLLEGSTDVVMLLKSLIPSLVRADLHSLADRRGLESTFWKVLWLMNLHGQAPNANRLEPKEHQDPSSDKR